MKLDAECPDEYCDEGWIDDGNCFGHPCPHPCHAKTLDERLDELVDELRGTLSGMVLTMFGKGNDGGD